jgi:hypothetical protein
VLISLVKFMISFRIALSRVSVDLKLEHNTPTVFSVIVIVHLEIEFTALIIYITSCL